MEWTITEQMLFFAESICLGLIIGILLDLFSGLGRGQSRGYRFWLDVLFGPLVAVLLFLGSLVILDGQLHPLLFFGSLCGAVLEHFTIGTYLSKFVFLLRKLSRTVTATFERLCTVFWSGLRKTAGLFPRLRIKMRKMRKNR